MACKLFVAVALLAPANALIAAPVVNAKLTTNNTIAKSVPKFMEVTLGPFNSAAEACDYCAESYTKQGDKPAGPVAPACVCMAYPDGSGHNMFCAAPVSAAGYIKSKGGCKCNPRDMEAMAATTCESY